MSVKKVTLLSLDSANPDYLDNLYSLGSEDIDGTKKSVKVAMSLLRGNTAFREWQERNPGKTYADWIKLLQEPAQTAADGIEKLKKDLTEFGNTAILSENARIDAEKQRVRIEGLRVEAETARAAAEADRKSAETLREDAEELRDQTETERNNSEAARKEAESSRVLVEGLRVDEEAKRAAAELIRIQAEQERATEEGKRVEVEKARVAAETLRDQSEKNRDEAEGLRDQAEASRAAEEADRDTSEQERITKETERIEAENLRISTESTRSESEDDRIEKERLRESSEQARKKAEEARETAEKARETNTSEAITNADKATKAATDAADRSTTLSDNRDKIVAGYWWKYDEALKDYVNTTIRATGETGQGLNIVGRYLAVDELKAAYPDGVVGCFEVGNESPYEIWYYDSPASEWRNSGRLQGPRGMSAYQVWQLHPGNEDKTEDEYFDWLSPAIDPDTGRWKVQGQDQGVQALGINAEVTEKENTEDSYILHVKSAKGEFDTPNIRGISVKVSEVENTEDSYKLGFKHAKGDFTTPNLRGISVKVVEKENTPDKYVLTFTHAKGEFTTPNLRGFDVKVEEVESNTPDDYKLKITTVAGTIITPNLQGRSGSAVIDIDHEPTEADTHYTYNGVQYAFSVGDEVRWYDADNEEYVLFKLYAVTEVGATWEELGSGGISLPADVILSSPTTLSDDDSLIFLDNGYLKGEA